MFFVAGAKPLSAGHAREKPISGTHGPCVSGPGKDYMDAAARSTTIWGRNRRFQIDTPCHSECPASCRKQTTGAPSDRHNSAPSSTQPYFDTIFGGQSGVEARGIIHATYSPRRLLGRSIHVHVERDLKYPQNCNLIFAGHYSFVATSPALFATKYNSPFANRESPRVQSGSLTLRLRANSIGLRTQLRSETGGRSEGGSGEGGQHVQRIS